MTRNKTPQNASDGDVDGDGDGVSWQSKHAMFHLNANVYLVAMPIWRAGCDGSGLICRLQ